LTAKSATCGEKVPLCNPSIIDFVRNFVSLDLRDMIDIDFENGCAGKAVLLQEAA
jgi:hypothetical protein